MFTLHLLKSMPLVLIAFTYSQSRKCEKETNGGRENNIICSINNLGQSSKDIYTFLENDVSNSRKVDDRVKGHLEPFGESGTQERVMEIQGFPSDRNKNFFLDFVLPSTPVLMKGAALRSPGYHKWTDKYLSRLSRLEENRNIKIDVEKGKKEKRQSGMLRMRFHEFTNVYNTSDMYMVSDVIPWMEPLTLMPCPLQCPQMAAVPINSVVWFSSGGTRSVVHTDDLENINCLYRGNKTLVMMDPTSVSTGTIIDNMDGTYSNLDVERVDLNRYSTLRGARFITATMQAGDCMYIPKYWIHQVRSFGSNLAINVWFHGKTTNEILRKGHCTGNDFVCDPTFTLARITHLEPPVSQKDHLKTLKHFFEYSSFHGKAAVLQGYPPMTKAEEKVNLEVFIHDFIEFYFGIGFEPKNTMGDFEENNLNDDRQRNSVNSAEKQSSDSSEVNQISKDDYYKRKILRTEDITNNRGDDNEDTDRGVKDNEENVGENIEDKLLERFVNKFRDRIREMDTDDDGILTWMEFEEGILDINRVFLEINY